MKLLLTIATLLLGIGSRVFGLNTFPAHTHPADNQTSYDNVDVLIEDFLKKTQVAGISISVSQSEEVIYSKAFGYADVKNKMVMKPTSRIRTASVAKVITATALGKLATDGKLDFDAPLKKYIPYLQEPYASLTTRQIAGHTAGIQHRPSSKKLKNKHYTDVKETIPFFENTTLLFKPDTEYAYSTLGYNLLAVLIEEVSGKKYIDYMKDDIFTPLNMTQTLPDNKSAYTESDAKSYYIKDGRLRLDNKFQDGSYKLAGAGFRSTSVDLVQMMNAYSNGFIAEKVVKDMFKSNRLANGDLTNVGIGWRSNKDMNDNYTIEHAGSWQGARTVIVYYPEKGLAISIMINTKCTLFIEESAQIIAQYFLSEHSGNKAFDELNKSLEIVNHRSDGSTEKYVGELKFFDKHRGALHIKTDRSWLKKNNIYHLSSGNNFALSTNYGLLYLQLTLKPSFEGSLFQYQRLGDRFHMSQNPMLYLKERD